MNMKTCKYCKSEIDKKAKVCPVCRKKLTKKWPIVVGILVALLIIGAIGGNKSSKDDNADKEVGSVNATNDISESKATDGESTAQSGEVTYPGVGAYIQGDDWKISLLSAKTYDNLPDAEGFYKDTPADGKKYLVLQFEVENISSEDNFFNYFYIDSYLDKYSIDPSITINHVDGKKMLGGDVQAGKKLAGYLAWEVPADWKEFQFTYKEWASSDKTTFVVKPDQLSK